MDKSLKTVLIVAGVIVTALVIPFVVSGLLWGGRDGGWGMIGPGMTGGYGTMFLMPVLWIVVIGLIVWAVAAAVRPGESSGSGPATTSSAFDVLKKRYARGEIGKQEYEEKKKDLS